MLTTTQGLLDCIGTPAVLVGVQNQTIVACNVPAKILASGLGVQLAEGDSIDPLWLALGLESPTRELSGTNTTPWGSEGLVAASDVPCGPETPPMALVSFHGARGGADAHDLLLGHAVCTLEADQLRTASQYALQFATEAVERIGRLTAQMVKCAETTLAG